MKTIENQQLVETTGGYRFAPACYAYAPAPYAIPARPAFAMPRAAYWPYAYGAYARYCAPPAIAARRAWWW